MRFRPLSGAMTICALFAVGASVASAAPKGVYKGSTGQDRTIRVKVAKRSIQIKQFKIELGCRDGSVLVIDEGGFLPTKVRNGRFRDVQYGRTDTVYIRGDLRGRRIRGKIRVTDKLKSGVRCQSRWVRFNAKPGGR